MVVFQANRLKSVEINYPTGVGLRVIKKGLLGFSSATGLDDPENLVTNAVESAKFGTHARFNFPSSSKDVPHMDILDRQIKDLELEDITNIGEEIIRLIHEKNSRINCDLLILKRLISVNIANSQGLDHIYTKSIFNLSISGSLFQQQKPIRVVEGTATCKLPSDYTSFVDELTEKIVQGKKIRRIPTTQSIPVVFTPKSMSSILLPLQVGINGKNVQRGVSPLCGKLGQKIADEKISIIDDGTLRYGLKTAPLDGEGVPQQRTPIIKNGLLHNFIYDLQTAGLMKAKSTGNASRIFDEPPSPATTNLIVEPGDMKYDEMIEDLKECLIVDQVIGKGQSNILKGEVILSVTLGFKVKNGESVGRVEGTMIAGNVYDALNNIVAISKESKHISSIRSPALSLQSLSIIGG